jgi:hypothetical protein
MSHERSVDELAEPVLAIVDRDHIALGGRAGEWVRANSIGGNPAQTLQEVCEGPVVEDEGSRCCSRHGGRLERWVQHTRRIVSLRSGATQAECSFSRRCWPARQWLGHAESTEDR